MSEKKELLDQLKIDRTEEPPRGVSVAWVVGIAIAAAGLAAGAVIMFMPPPPPPPTTGQIATVTDTAAPTASKPAPKAAVPKASGPKAGERILNASGYITARRIATVSAEIMGLITEVNVEEGMEVSPGQVLAKLDNAVATVDLNLARAQERCSEPG